MNEYREDEVANSIVDLSSIIEANVERYVPELFDDVTTIGADIRNLLFELVESYYDKDWNDSDIFLEDAQSAISDEVSHILRTNKIYKKFNVWDEEAMEALVTLTDWTFEAEEA